MASQEAQALEELVLLGQALFQNFTRTILFCTFYGIYCLLFITAVYISSWKKFTGWSKNTMLCLLIATSISVTLFMTANVALNMIFLRDETIVPVPAGKEAQAAASQPFLEVGAQISNWTSTLIFLIGDIIIIWRAWAVWMHSKIVKSFLALILLVTIVLNLADASEDSKKNLFVTGQSVTIDWVFFAISLSLNVILTLLIAYQTWKYYRFRRSTSTVTSKTIVGRILLLLVESGAFWAIFQVLNLTFKALDLKASNLSPLQFATLIVSVFYIYVTALNPLAIFILVETNNTYDQHSGSEQNTSHAELTTVLSEP
ncbi:hypothetical protein BDP27DRAFT_1324068 [Rhodocollybia butyracea]|uniref:Uncharacterized protein n=1 Tax=Rhodocollybia butyracea TaxID=206335 RepID=A0A9P5PW70_9AGAR|nr:hypothetical protein BDP27DRAFT_1324068 [Rhodocollybia butyracea]